MNAIDTNIIETSATDMPTTVRTDKDDELLDLTLQELSRVGGGMTLTFFA